jgi:hypothetical protein
MMPSPFPDILPGIPGLLKVLEMTLTVLKKAQQEQGIPAPLPVPRTTRGIQRP